jgi:hypothetical protein
MGAFPLQSTFVNYSYRAKDCSFSTTFKQRAEGKVVSRLKVEPKT